MVPSFSMSVRALLLIIVATAMAPSRVGAQSAPAITSQPQSRTVTVSSNAFFAVSATGQTPLSYQWSRNSGNLSDGAHIIGSTTSVLTINSVVVADAGSYRVVVTNRHGNTTSSAAILTPT